MRRYVAHGTFTIERLSAQEPSRVLQAFADPREKRRWFAEGEGFVVDRYEPDFRVGGFEGTLLRMTETTAVVDGVDGTEDRRKGTIGLLEALARRVPA